MKGIKTIFIFIFIFGFTLIAQSVSQPSIGYIYPSGGKKGSSVQILVGGQNLRGVKDICCSSDGIMAETIIYIPVLNNMQRNYLLKKISELKRKNKGIYQEKKLSQDEIVELPDNPLLKNLENLSPEELDKIFEIFLMPIQRVQIKRSIQEKVLIYLKVDSDVEPKKYEIRLLTQRGLTNPLFFEVNTFNEINEKEPNGPIEQQKNILDLPIIVNGRIMPGDVDRFWFNAKKGQFLFIELKARDIIPYMADAVPGWFQGILTLYKSKGKEIFYADNYYFNPDPIIFYEVEEDGEYIIEVRDALFRGREDFVYRLIIGEKSAFKNNFQEIKNVINSDILNKLPEICEKEPNDKLNKANYIILPQIIKGIIEKPGDIDTYKFKGEIGEEIIFDVYSRRLGYPLDSFIRILDNSGKTLKFNDDYEDKSFGLITHNADSYTSFVVPKDGYYYLQILDIQNHGGDNYLYYIRIENPEPDFKLFVIPSSINILAGRNNILNIYAIRKDGFDGEIKISLKEPNPNFILNGGRIPKGKDNVRITISSLKAPYENPFDIQIEGSTIIEGKEVKRIAIPAEEMMQAFAYFHLVPFEKNFCYVINRGKISQFDFKLIDEDILKIPIDGVVNVKVKTLQKLKSDEISLELKEPPKEISIEDVKIENGILSFNLRTNGKEIKSGFADNLIIEVFRENKTSTPEKPVQKVEKVSIGFLPAISFEII
ncbi:MAG TPA: PPC domain-containing protein [bacterium]|nr:PPC domain-containing protein [bacterium]